MPSHSVLENFKYILGCHTIVLFSICHIFLCKLLGASQSRWATSRKPHGRFRYFLPLVCLRLHGRVCKGHFRTAQTHSALCCQTWLNFNQSELYFVTLSSISISRWAEQYAKKNHIAIILTDIVIGI